MTQRILKEIGIETCGEVLDKAAVVQMCFKQSTYQWLISSCFGIAMNRRDPNEVYQRKSISQERTFGAKGISSDDRSMLEGKIKEICHGLYAEIKEKQIRGKTVTVKIKTIDFETKTRAQTLGSYTDNESVILNQALQILRKEYPIKVRLLGVKLSGLEQKEPGNKKQRQLDSFWKKHKAPSMDIDGDDSNVSNKNDSPDGVRENVNGNLTRKRKRKWKDMMDSEGLSGETENTTPVTKRRKINDDASLDSVQMMQCENDQNEDIDIVGDDSNHSNSNGNGNTLSQMFGHCNDLEAERDTEIKEKLQCPVCCRFQCASNLELNFHLDRCLAQHTNNKRDKPAKSEKGNQSQKSSKSKKGKTKAKRGSGNKNTLTRFFKMK